MTSKPERDCIRTTRLAACRCPMKKRLPSRACESILWFGRPPRCWSGARLTTFDVRKPSDSHSRIPAATKVVVKESTHLRPNSDVGDAPPRVATPHAVSMCHGQVTNLPTIFQQAANERHFAER